MEHPEIKKLYKYTSFSVRSISALVTGKLWFPKPNTLNDPFDCTIVNHSKGLLTSLEKRGRRIKSSLNKLRPDKFTQSDFERKIYFLHDKFLTTVTEHDRELVKLNEDAYSALQPQIHDFGVLSLSASPKNILMWSHYGAYHAGICLEFERHETNKLGIDAKSVTYSRKREIKAPDITDETRNLFYVKHSGWRYEREWRLLETKGNQLYDFPGKLISVICGALMPAQDIETITMIVESINANRGDNTSVKFAKMSDKNYSISICKRHPIRF